MSTRKLAVVAAGLRQPSSTRLLADRLAEATQRALGGVEIETKVDVIELRDSAHDLTNNLLAGFASPSLREAIDSVTGADGVIAVTPIFTASYSGLFKSFFDVLDADALTGKPVLMGATGGTERHSLALEHAVRPMFAYLRSIVVPTAVYAASTDWGSTDSNGDALAERVERAARELAQLMSSGQAAPKADPFDVPTPLAQLLAG